MSRLADKLQRSKVKTLQRGYCEADSTNHPNRVAAGRSCRRQSQRSTCASLGQVGRERGGQLVQADFVG